jgi:hypothetical protein
MITPDMLDNILKDIECINNCKEQKWTKSKEF